MKIAIVNESEAAVEAMRSILDFSGRHQVAWSAEAGADAVEFCRSNPPDLLLTDLSTRGMDGIEVIRRIMDVSPCAILIVTGAIEANSAKLFDAMGAGAVDVVQAPCAESVDPARNGAATFLGKIDSVAYLIGNAAPRVISASSPQCAKKLVAIGSSAGGPAALAVLLRDLPAEFPAAVIVVQHIDAQFAPGLAKWLSQQSRLPVRPALAGDAPLPGVVLLASTNDHLVFESAIKLGYTPNPVDYSYRPSINALFESAARHWRGELIGVLLTGMGRDGAKGLKMIRNLGHHTIAQDQKTSAVYGMPRAAADLKAAAEILPLGQIGPTLGRLFVSTSRSCTATSTPAAQNG